MKLVDYTFDCPNAVDSLSLFAIGDVHIGANNCVESKLQHMVSRIASDPNAFWVGGGDICDAVTQTDIKRFDPSLIPDWMLQGQSPQAIKDNMKDVITAQMERAFSILDPIKHKCLGMIEGNHEYSIMKYHNRDIQRQMCRHFEVEDLTDCAFLRFTFRNGTKTAAIRGFVAHGCGGGRTSGAEPMKLYHLAADKDVDFVLRGHSHTFHIHPPIPVLSVPTGFDIPHNPSVSDKMAANWGCYVYTYQTGPSTYASRANYPARPMYTVETKMTPFHVDRHGVEAPIVEMNTVRL